MAFCIIKNPMLKEIIGEHVEEVAIRIYYRQDPEGITKDLYGKVLGYIQAVHDEFERSRKIQNI